ncbi:hypothetical protein Bca4012_084788 [Brassica carinata]
MDTPARLSSTCNTDNYLSFKGSFSVGEFSECLVARAEAKALKESLEEVLGKQGSFSGAVVGENKGISSDPSHRDPVRQDREQRKEIAFRFSASNNEDEQRRRPGIEHRASSQTRTYKSHQKSWQEKGSHRRSSQAKERSEHEYERSSRPYQVVSQRNLPGPPSRSFYREVARISPAPRDSGSVISKTCQELEGRGNPQKITSDPIPPEILNEARKELHDVMLQYTSSADPTEREARKERVRQAEEQGDFEETAIQMARSSLEKAGHQGTQQAAATPERVSVTHRLGPCPHQSSKSLDSPPGVPKQNSQDRIPAALRLGPFPPPPNLQDDNLDGEEHLNVGSTERLPASMRLGCPAPPPLENDLMEQPKSNKRKSGCPPGKKTQDKPLPPVGPVIKKRRVTQSKGSPARRKLQSMVGT